MCGGGHSAERIILDPGFGFAKTLQHNLSLFKHMEALHALGPLLVGVSRKSMIGQALNRPVGERCTAVLHWRHWHD
jgi:dihydropteroate synthase